jgi:hypothetical protein
MKVTRQPKPHQSSPGAFHETIVAAWRALGRESAGADELVSIQQTLADETISPAKIARELAKEGIELRHPEVILSDARWRQAQFEQQAKMFAGVTALCDALPLRLKDAESALAELERLRQTFGVTSDSLAVDELKALAVESRETAISRAHNSALSPQDREVQAEIAEWLRVWLETPNLFAQWLELRKASSTFTAKFPDY